MNCVTTSERRKNCARTRVKERWDPVALSLSPWKPHNENIQDFSLCYVEMKVTAKGKNGP